MGAGQIKGQLYSSGYGGSVPQIVYIYSSEKYSSVLGKHDVYYQAHNLLISPFDNVKKATCY